MSTPDSDLDSGLEITDQTKLPEGEIFECDALADVATGERCRRVSQWVVTFRVLGPPVRERTRAFCQEHYEEAFDD